MLSLAEELLLLALDDESGSVSSAASSSLEYGLAGAMLVELVISGRLGMAGGGLVVADGSPTGDDALDDALAQIEYSRRARDPEYWVGRFGSLHPKGNLIKSLLDKGILRREERRILWVIPSDRYPARDAGPERDVRERIRAVILDGAEPQPRDAALISLIKACDLTDEVFYSDERERARQRLDSIADSELIGKAVSGAVARAQAATQAAVTGAVVAATTSYSAPSSS